MKRYYITIYLDPFQTYVSAKNLSEAKKKAIEKLKRKAIHRLISHSYPSHRKEIDIEVL